jgi:hypothetical protein
LSPSNVVNCPTDDLCIVIWIYVLYSDVLPLMKLSVKHVSS